tara:strand:+ start:55 stop:1848 length:1794 start_codon:yes stop_codon:yes gene_type:complete
MKDYRIAISESSEALLTLSDKDKKTYLAFVQDEKSFVEVSCSSSNEISEFFDRSKILQNFTHPQLSKTVDVYIENGEAYCISQFIDGEDLSAYSKRVHSVPVEYIIGWMLQFLDGLLALESRGLSASLSTSRLYCNEIGEAELIIPECAVYSGSRETNLGNDVSGIVKHLSNLQEPGEPMVCPREIEVLASRIGGMNSVDDVLMEMRKIDISNKGNLDELFYPRSFLEREMFKRFRPEHLLPDNFVAMQKGLFHSKYERLFEDQTTQQVFRIIVLPPERIVSRKDINLDENEKNPVFVKVDEVDEHDDFLLIRESYSTGFSIEEFIERSGNRSLDEIIYLMQRVHEALDEVQKSQSPLKQLFEFNVLVEFEKLGGYGLNSLVSVVPLNNWPPFEIKVRTHLTIPTMTFRNHFQAKDSSDELIAKVKQGSRVSSKQLFGWYFYMQRTSLRYAASSFLDDLQKTIGRTSSKPFPNTVKINQPATEVIKPNRSTESILERDDESSLGVSPIAVAMGYNRRSEETNDEEESNPIAKQLNKREDMDEILDLSLLESGGSSLEDFSKPRRNKSIIFALILMLLAIGMALLFAHLSGRAFWLQS